MEYFLGFDIKITDDTNVLNCHTWKNALLQKTSVEFFYNQIPKDRDVCILDIGAQSGAFSLMSKFLPNTTWHSFEPDPTNFKLLTDNLKLNDIENVKVYNLALSNIKSQSVFNICEHNRGLNTLGNNVKRFNKNESKEIIVETDTIDNLFLDVKVDFIKIDTEGAEFNILLGGSKTLKKYKPKILLEYYNDNLEQFQVNINDLNNLIRDLGYKITSKIDDCIYIESL